MCRQYGISVLIAQASFQGETSCGIAKCWLFSQVIQSLYFFGNLKILNLSSHTVGMKLQCINAAINSKIQYDGPANFICGEFSCPANLSFCQFSFFFVIFNYQAFHKTLRKGLIQILLGVTIGEILTIAIVLQQATWILQQYCNIKGTIAIALP